METNLTSDTRKKAEGNGPIFKAPKEKAVNLEFKYQQKYLLEMKVK